MDKNALYIVATPIGNLKDITLRALEVLRAVDFIACEDTRVTKKLLSHFGIKTPVISYFQHSRPARVQKIIGDLLAGKSAALVTDAGTPGISDPGNILVAEAIKNEIKVVPVPGASALAALASVSGIDMQKFVFTAFPPHKKGREKFFKEVNSSRYPVVYYDSPYRVLKNLPLLEKSKKLIIGRELTKMFEETVRGAPEDIIDYFGENKDRLKGEFVIIVY